MFVNLDVNSRKFLLVLGGVLASPDEESLFQGDEPIAFVDALDQVRFCDPASSTCACGSNELLVFGQH